MLSPLMNTLLLLSTQVLAYSSEECECECDAAPDGLQKIVGGEEAEEREFPFMVSLIKDSIRCGGTLITSIHVLTAAHCFDEFKSVEGLWVILGSIYYDLSLYEIPARHMEPHPEYNRENTDNDIGIVSLKFEMDFSDYIQPACLPTIGKLVDYSGEMGLTLGWGFLNEQGDLPKTLRKVAVPILNFTECVNFYDPERVYISKNMICAGYLEGEKDSCHGDSGGPLIAFNKQKEKREVIGIVSFGLGCARPKKPGVYTKVENYLDWIKENVDDSYICKHSLNLKCNK